MSSEAPQLYAAREPIFPRRVYGKFRQLKWWIMILTLGIYYLTPWIRWDRGPNLPDQAVLIDLANRRFFFFWIEIWPQEFYFVAGLLIMAGIGLFLFTSALGRVWCGYTCPQTVWTDLFILVERWIEGDRNARIRLWKQKYNFKKFRLRLTKWAVWFMIGLATGGAWVFYFADAPTLLVDMLTGQAAVVAYASVFILTMTTFIFGGFMREQVCIYMCPWPRIQAAMMDEDTLTVSYRDWRGEPRGKHRKADGADQLGDCIDCNACVAVCPMGIDIRDGQQLACITCALCIDACDDVMTKIGKPRGLIDYITLNDEPLERAGAEPRSMLRHIMRPRILMYTALWALIGVGLLVALFIRPEIDINVSPVRNPVFVTMSDGTIRNAYDIRLRNKHGEERNFHVSVTGDAALNAEIQGENLMIVQVPPDATRSIRVYLSATPNSPAATATRTEVRFWVEDVTSGERSYANSLFNGNPK
ncbi:MAG TPA: cytochrome c oxidase accessory protein CcoG [Paracoccaceae bacterium]|nr:cytochrome c oxidase accessory protein CcoG [Paracoccaceae bacterium]